MNTFKDRLQEVTTFFNHKDTDLGFRKLLDLGMDTQDMTVYKMLIDLTAWKEENPEEQEQLIKKSLKAIDVLNGYEVPVASRDENVLHALDVIKTYPNSNFKLGPVSVSIKKGNVYGLVGENGNGKTTLLRVLAQQLVYQSGTIDYNFNSKPDSSYDLRRKLVYIPQRTQVWYGSLKNNLRFVLSSYGVAPEEIEPRILMIIARLGLWNYQDLKWSELSSGYKMRFELARTLLRKPEVLLLDEPLANLDVLAQQTVLEDLLSICNSINHPIALILSSQQLYEVEKVSDKVIYLKNGAYTDNDDNNISLLDQQLIIEIECKEDREQLLHAFNTLPLDKLLYNGGVYLAYFNNEVSFAQVLKQLGHHNLDIVYMRNISNSTRRFFVS